MKIHIVTDNEIHSNGSAGNILEALASIDGGDIGQSSWKDASLNISGDPEMLFLDIDSNSKVSWEKVTEVREAFPRTYTVLLANDDRFAAAAFGLHLDGYLLNPVTKKQIEDELENYLEKFKFRQSVAAIKSESGRAYGLLTIRTGRNFECFADGRPVHFRRSKTKGLLKYLTDNPGRMIPNDEIIDHLWGIHSRSNKSCLRTITAEIIDLFKTCGRADEIVKYRGYIGYFPAGETVQEPKNHDADSYGRVPARHNAAGSYLAAGVESY